ncbi:MAG: hypothetical protein JOZ75_04495, partial [Candidatus Dormibacteraeota bacterium]|nr:hypothetical protein [Candidatus Dormibacteraeota bacterium]
MNTATAQIAEVTAPNQRPLPKGLYINAFAAGVMLLVQYALGIWVTLVTALPNGDVGAGFWGASFRAITHGPLNLSLHAILGTLLLISAVTLVVRAVLARRTSIIIVAAAGLLSVLLAWLGGDRFVDTGATTPSLLMGWST